MKDIKLMTLSECETRISAIQAKILRRRMPPAKALIYYGGELELLERRIQSLKRKEKVTDLNTKPKEE
jgi:hypothetical protein